MKNIQFVTAIHGDEPMPVLALASSGVRQIIANKKALSLGKRFIQIDMNASFGKKGNSYEEKRAREVLYKIDKKTIVIDLHTFSAMSKPFVIMVDLKMLNFAKTLGIKDIVYMKHNIKKGHALINYRNGVSIEVGNHTDPKSFERTLNIIETIRKKGCIKSKITVYEVYDKIKNKGDYINFQVYNDSNENFYPVLAGENAYDFFGLKAKILKDV